MSDYNLSDISVVFDSRSSEEYSVVLFARVGGCVKDAMTHYDAARRRKIENAFRYSDLLFQSAPRLIKEQMLALKSDWERARQILHTATADDAIGPESLKLFEDTVVRSMAYRHMGSIDDSISTRSADVEFEIAWLAGFDFLTDRDVVAKAIRHMSKAQQDTLYDSITSARDMRVNDTPQFVARLRSAPDKVERMRRIALKFLFSEKVDDAEVEEIAGIAIYLFGDRSVLDKR